MYTVIMPSPFWAAQVWAALYPGDERPPCCYASVHDATRCTCWRPVYAEAQQDPCPPASAQEMRVAASMCGDCAFRKTSPERSDASSEEHLLALPGGLKPFWCHEGMRRPARWQHPDGRMLPADEDDWHPARLGNMLYRADGMVAALCHGWARRAAALPPYAPPGGRRSDSSGTVCAPKPHQA